MLMVFKSHLFRKLKKYNNKNSCKVKVKNFFDRKAVSNASYYESYYE